MVRSGLHRVMALEAISRSRFFAFCARDPANRICSPCSACSAYMGQGRGKCSGYRRSTITKLKEVFRGFMSARHQPPPSPVKSATSATTATHCTIEHSNQRRIVLLIGARGEGHLGSLAGSVRTPIRRKIIFST